MNPQAKLLWKSIRNSRCEECTLHQHAQTVCLVGDGPVPAEIMIVGEAPGYREDEIRKPFSGKSGRLLDETLAKVGLDRSQAFVTNVVKCRPKENATPNKTQMNACRHYLDDELEAVKPQFILTLGNPAMSLIKKSGIMKHRGEWHPYGDAQVFSTVHPAAVLRNPRYRGLFEADFAAFARGLKGIDAEVPPPKTYLVNNTKALHRCVEAILKADAVAYDIETNGFDELDPDMHIATISFSPKAGVAFVVPIEHPEARWKDAQRVLEILCNALVYTDAKCIAHNAKFDDKWLSHFSNKEIRADFDTILAAHLLDENRLKSLKVLAPLLLGVDAWGLDMSEGKAMTYPLNRLAKYNAKDTDYTLRLYEIFKKDLKRPGNERTVRIFQTLMMPASRALTEIEAHGMWVDEKRLADRRIMVNKKLTKIKRQLDKHIGHEINFNSPMQVAVVLFEQFGLDVIDTTKTGKPSTNESVMLRLAAEHPVPQLILDWRQWKKNESTYLTKWASKLVDHRIHPNYKLSGTVTGRLSGGKEGAKDSRVGVQQVPRDPLIRGIIGAPPGWSFVEADFSQVELRVAAHAAQEPTMMRLFNIDEDIHLTMAMQMTGKPAHLVTKEERKKAKAVNFGFLYGMGYRKFVDYARDNYGVVVTEAEAKMVRDRFFSTFSHLQRWHERQRRLVQQYGQVQSAIGRVRHLPDVYSEDKDVRAEAERQAINSPIQSLASDMMLLSMVMLHPKLPTTEAVITGSVHDSLLFEIRDDKIDHWAPYIKHTMENLPLKKKFGCTLSVPIKCDVKVGAHWGEGEEVA